MLSQNFTLKELYFRWNKITHFGGSSILQGLEEKQNLAVLDLSYNNLG
jgi:Leucine-rich repeat (LRR) protein